MKTKGRENMVKFAVISIVLAGLILFDLTVGTNRISLGNIFDYFFFPRQLTSSTVFTIKEFRLARVITAVVAGAALAVSGLLMQTIFRNPLAGPYVLGISNGAGLGVAVVVLGGSIWGFSHSIETSNWMILAASGLGAAAVLMLILAVSMRVKDVLSILIIGILISGVVASIVSIMQFFSNDVNVKSYVVWTMGSLDAVSFTESVLLIPICMSVALVLYMFSKPLNLMLLGESFATTMGVNIKLIRVVVFTGVSILTGAVTAFCGPLGFLGLAVPHISRWIFNTSNHFILIPASVILGAVFLLCGDILSHTMYAGGVLPINAIISVLGAPFIIWIVFKNQRTII
ncbi:MAG: iron ABC transporter permease [Bacteroidales bacterium]|nr:iron ABC transporter permease [Bacteroidales bacterium]